jgi:hypothetical protein
MASTGAMGGGYLISKNEKDFILKVRSHPTSFASCLYKVMDVCYATDSSFP